MSLFRNVLSFFPVVVVMLNLIKVYPKSNLLLFLSFSKYYKNHPPLFVKISFFPWQKTRMVSEKIP